MKTEIPTFTELTITEMTIRILQTEAGGPSGIEIMHARWPVAH